jgi:hypothetical protein
MNPANYRGLTIMDVLPKLYATILTARLDEEIDTKRLRAPT